MRPAGESGYRVEEAANGLQAFDRARIEPPDLIISDILMPEMDGFALCRIIKSIETLKHIPFVFYTATYLNQHDEELGLWLGLPAISTNRRHRSSSWK